MEILPLKVEKTEKGDIVLTQESPGAEKQQVIISAMVGDTVGKEISMLSKKISKPRPKATKK